MSKITKNELEKIANLSRIEINEDQMKEIVRSFDPIIKMIDQVNEVDISKDVKRNFYLKNIMREDEVTKDTSKNRDDVLREFPERKDDYLKTKKILSN